MQRRSRGNLRAAKQQRDISNVVLRHKMNVTCGQKNEIIDTDYRYDWQDNDIIAPVTVENVGCAFVNVYDVIRRSDYFKNLSGLYDQIRINAIKVDITSVDWPQSNNESGDRESGYVFPKTLSVVTAWDRSGLGADQVQYEFNKSNIELPNYVNEDDIQVVPDESKRMYCTIGNEITTYSSALIRHLGPGSNLKVTRYLYPESFTEKSQFLPVDTLKPQYDKKEEENYYRLYGVVYNDEENRLNRRYFPYDLDTSLPTNPINNPSCMFKPTFLINVVTGEGPNFKFENGRIVVGNNLKPATFCLDFSIDVTFRGLRYSKLV